MTQLWRIYMAQRYNAWKTMTLTDAMKTKLFCRFWQIVFRNSECVTIFHTPTHLHATCQKFKIQSKSRGKKQQKLCKCHIFMNYPFVFTWLATGVCIVWFLYSVLINLWKCATSQSPFWTFMSSTTWAEPCDWLLPYRANHCQAFRSQGQGCLWIFRTSSKFYLFL